MRRLSVALEQLLDPLVLSEAGSANGGVRAGPEQVVANASAPARESGASRDSLFDRVAAAVARLRWRQANAVYRLRWSQAKGYRVARAVFTTIAIVAVSCGISIVVLLVTMRG